jgi:hypothetical protein
MTFDEWRVKMNTSTTQARNFSPKVGKIATAIALALALGGLGMTPAFGEEHDNRGANEGDRGHDSHNTDRARHNSRPASHHAYQYAQPAYAPAPVYYAPQPSPGISLFIPISIR